MDIVFIGLGILVCWRAVSRYKGRTRHERYIQSAKRRLGKLNQIAHQGQQFAYLRQINPYVFEEMVLTALQNKGYSITRSVSYSKDGGIDGKAWFKGKTYFIQSKRYNRQVKTAHILSFDELCRKKKVFGLFVHTGKTPKGVCKQLSPQTRILSGEALLSLLSV